METKQYDWLNLCTFRLYCNKCCIRKMRKNPNTNSIKLADNNEERKPPNKYLALSFLWFRHEYKQIRQISIFSDGKCACVCVFLLCAQVRVYWMFIIRCVQIMATSKKARRRRMKAKAMTMNILFITITAPPSSTRPQHNAPNVGMLEIKLWKVFGAETIHK